jgi:hypothetical protein
VATYSQGCTVSFTGATFTEVTSVQADIGGGMAIGRDNFAYAQSGGSVTVESLGGSWTYGAYGQLSISGGGISLTRNAVCTGVSATAAANDVTRYSVTFELIV